MNKHELFKRRPANKMGVAPGTLVHVGDVSHEPVRIRVIAYDHQQLLEKQLDSMAQIPEMLGKGAIDWINVDGVHQVEVIQAFGEQFGLHPLVLEDILNTDQRPKIEDYGAFLYIVVKMLQFNGDRLETCSEQVSLIVGKNYVLSLQERVGDVFDGVRERLRVGLRQRFMRPDYLAYSLIDAIVDNYFSILEQFGDHFEQLEEHLMRNPTTETLARIQHFKREMLLLRKAVWPLREVLNSLIRDETTLIAADTRLFLRDVYDHTIHIADTIETLRDLLSGMLDLYISSVSHRMNEVMKVLTLIATVFMPLTFIAGVYGMNFEYMPELGWHWAYPAVMVGMATIALGLVGVFRYKQWF